MAAEVTATPAAKPGRNRSRRKYPITESPLTKQDVLLAVTSPDFRDNLISDLKRLGYRKIQADIDNAVQAALIRVLAQADKFFTSQAGLRKWAYDTARGFLVSKHYRTAAHQGKPEEKLSIDAGWKTGERVIEPAVEADGKTPVPQTVRRADGTLGEPCEPDRFSPARLTKADIKRGKLENSKPIVKVAGRDFVATPEDYAVLARVQKQYLDRPNYDLVKQSARRKGWVGKREKSE